MTRTPAWIDLARRSTAAAARSQTASGGALALDAPRRGENDNGGAMPSTGLSTGGRAAALLPSPAPRRRRLGAIAALILSAAVHAAAFAWLARGLPPEGADAASDGISVELVFDVPVAPSSAAIAGRDGTVATDGDQPETEEAPVAGQAVAEAVRDQTVAAPVAPVEIAEPAIPEPAATVEPDLAETIDAPSADEAGPVDPIRSDAAAAAPPQPAEAAERPEAVEASPVDGVAVAAPETIAPVEPAPAPPVPVAPDAPTSPSSDAGAASVAPVAPGITMDPMPAGPQAVEAAAPNPAEQVSAEPAAPVATAGAEPLPAEIPDAAAVAMAEPVAPVEPATARPAVPDEAQPPVAGAAAPAAPAVSPPAPDDAMAAVPASPPATTTLPGDPPDVVLPQTVAQRPEPRPQPRSPAAEPARKTAVRTQAQARPAVTESRDKAATRQPQTQKERARAAATSADKPAAAPTGRAASAASAGSQARAAAAPGAEAAYGRRVLSHVQRYKRYPAAARNAGITGVARLSIVIDRAGGLAAARISSGSGHAILDQEALAVARRAAPYPRPPEGVGGSTFSIAVTLRFTR